MSGWILVGGGGGAASKSSSCLLKWHPVIYWCNFLEKKLSSEFFASNKSARAHRFKQNQSQSFFACWMCPGFDHCCIGGIRIKQLNPSVFNHPIFVVYLAPLLLTEMDIKRPSGPQLQTSHLFSGFWSRDGRNASPRTLLMSGQINRAKMTAPWTWRKMYGLIYFLIPQMQY